MAKKQKTAATKQTSASDTSAANPQAALPLSLKNQIDKKDALGTILDHYKSWLPRYQTFSQSRSNFQIEKMIATEHVTPAASYQHTLYQLRVLHQSLITDFTRGIEEQRLFDYKWSNTDQSKPLWWDTEKGGKKLLWYDTDRIHHEHEMDELKMSITDKLQQLDTFTKILFAMEKKHGGLFTQEELEREEPEYWKHRLARQMGDEYLDRQTGLGTGNIKSLRMAVAESPLPGSDNKVEDFPDLINAVLSGRELSLEVLNEINETLFARMNVLGAGEHTPAVSTAESSTTKPPEKAKSDAPAATATIEKQPAASTDPDELARLQSVGIGVSRSKQ